MILRHSISRRDALLVILGASIMHIFTFFYPSHSSPELSESIVIRAHLQDVAPANLEPLPPPPEQLYLEAEDATVTITETAYLPQETEAEVAQPSSVLPHTSIIAHAPGWTLFRNLYMAGGTLYILSSNRSFPEIRMMTSTGLAAENTPENIALREPTEKNMDFVTPQEAYMRWGQHKGVMTVEGNTLLFNDPPQFLRHYYHLVAELFFGVQAFWHGAFSQPSTSPEAAVQLQHPAPPHIDRAIFAHSNADGWRDDPGFNSYFMRAAFPSITTEHEEDWADRILTTSGRANINRVWRFPTVLLTDRSAAHRGVVCGSQTQRTAAEAWSHMKEQNRLMGEGVGGWWEPIRSAVLRFAGVKAASELYEYGKEASPGTEAAALPMPEKIVITYIGRQSARHRKLTDEAHDSLLSALTELAERNRDTWELIIMEAEKLTKDEQLEVVGRTHILLGVHGNGLTHLVFMPPTRISTVIEIFYPGGFAHDYQWTTHALGMKHFAVWNDTHYTLPNKPGVDYPEGFQENYIPVHGPAVAQLIEDRVSGLL